MSSLVIKVSKFFIGGHIFFFGNITQYFLN